MRKNARVKAGMMKCTMLPAPEAGSRLVSTLKMKISTMPRKKVGTEAPSTDSPRNARSATLSGRRAAKIPKGMPIATAMPMASPTSSSVTGTRDSSSGMAGVSL